MKHRSLALALCGLALIAGAAAAAPIPSVPLTDFPRFPVATKPHTSYVTTDDGGTRNSFGIPLYMFPSPVAQEKTKRFNAAYPYGASVSVYLRGTIVYIVYGRKALTCFDCHSRSVAVHEFSKLLGEARGMDLKTTFRQDGTLTLFYTEPAALGPVVYPSGDSRIPQPQP